ncbi:dihydrofolate reductase family protein [Brachybacterium alimentarium]|uniref:dihydrofolate reductase family protein n=1 Tax=Brachybacterium alimentarium TaxID=47845 RepID=UPI000DF17791|nr:RibD family protein [Brachybacterium alimentarium]RCS71527.1 pyrimidine reductase [Brachybacterium alimentarium]RCS92129.1 pyrimidine reductase [Brachybacterium alimentarium]
MSRPRIICHMHTLLNGKIDGIANPTSVGMRSQKLYFDLFLGKDRFYTKHRGWISGGGTSRALLGSEPGTDLPEPTEPVPAGDFLASPDARMFYFAVDGSGTLAWDRSSFNYFDVEAHIVELIPASVSDAFKAHLRSVGVSYILAGEEQLDMAQAVRRIGEIFEMDELILGGGGTLNWSMVRDGLCDEISLVLMPTADGETPTNSLFEANEKYSAPVPIQFALKNVEALDDGSVWLRYDVLGPVDDA